MTDILFDPNRLPFFNHARPVAKDTLSFHEFAVETAADEVFLMQADSMIVYVNEAACNTLGYTKDELIGMYVWEWDPLFPKTAWPGFWDEFVQAKHLHFETRHKTKQGLIFPVEIHAHLYQENDELFLLAFVNDLSAIKAIEANKALKNNKNLYEILTGEIDKSIIREKKLSDTVGLTGAAVKELSKIPVLASVFKAEDVKEVTDEVIDGKQSVVWRQALNRVHAQKSIIKWCLD